MSMKKKNFWSAVLAMGLAATLSVGFVGCSDDDEPTPEIVTDNPLDKEVYYIAGKVTEGGKSLEGVEVSTSGKSAKTAADGTYQLAMDKVGTYVVTFAKDGYVTVTADAVILSGTPKHGSVALSQTLTSLAASVTVSADQDTVVYDERTHVAELACSGRSREGRYRDHDDRVCERGKSRKAIMPVCRLSTARLTD